jgi:phosphate transport system permease protein
MRAPVSFLIELLAAIPSIIYGLWDFFILAPMMRGAIEPLLKNTLGNVPVVARCSPGPPSDATSWLPA